MINFIEETLSEFSENIAELNDRAIRSEQYWGNRVPMMVMEECGELIQAISKAERGKDPVRLKLKEEIRDVVIGLLMLTEYYDIEHTDILFMALNKLKEERKN